MSLKRIFCALMCALLVVSGLALAEEDKDARIAELEAQIETYTVAAKIRWRRGERGGKWKSNTLTS